MPAVHTSDSRSVSTVDDAKGLMTQIRKLTCEREIIVARAEKRIAAISEKAQADIAEVDTRIAPFADQLNTFILTHKDQFEKPRAVKTPDGRFGLRSVSNVDVFNEDRALDCICAKGYDDCIERRVSFKKSEIAKILRDGKKIDGCRLEEGELAFFIVDKTLVNGARESVIDTSTEE